MIRSIPPFTAKCRTVREKGGFRFIFFCELCGRGYTTPHIPQENQKDALRLGEQDARLHFSRCQCCGRWVCDEDFNENWITCTDCVPRICIQCGYAVPKESQYCIICGTVQFETDRRGEKNE